MKKIIYLAILFSTFAFGQREIAHDLDLSGNVEVTGTIEVPNAIIDSQAPNMGQVIDSISSAISDIPGYTGSTSIILVGDSFQRAALSGGDITGSQNSNTLTINNSAVTNAKMANMAASTFKGRISTTGAPQDLTVSQMITVLGLIGTSGQFLVTNSGGTALEKRILNGGDVNIATTGDRVVTWNGSSWRSNGYLVSSTLQNSTLALRKSTGQIEGATPTTANELTPKSYVDEANALNAPLNNPTFTGDVVVPIGNALNEAVNLAQLNTKASLNADNHFTEINQFDNLIVSVLLFWDPVISPPLNAALWIDSVAVSGADTDLEATSGAVLFKDSIPAWTITGSATINTY